LPRSNGFFPGSTTVLNPLEVELTNVVTQHAHSNLLLFSVKNKN